MSDVWIGAGAWEGWRLTTGTDGIVVLISPDGRAYGPGDIAGRYTQADLAKAIGVSRAAIADRIKRGTLPPFDSDKTWRYQTIRHVITKGSED